MKKPTTCVDFEKAGISTAMFDEYLGDFVKTELIPNHIVQKGVVGGKTYELKIRLTRWTGRTSPEQIVTLSRLFFANYPKMYERFGAVGESPTKITLDIENRGYGIAWNAGKLVHLHDGWLEKWQDDYDCITHELAHAIQNGWEDETLEYGGFIEIFADVCRYLYAFDDGRYNDTGWQMRTVENEPTREESVRFPVWFDYVYSTPDNDLLLNYFRVCREGKYKTERWREAWQEIFKGSLLEGRDIDDIYREYCESDFARLSTKVENGVSPLISQYDVRRNTR